MIAIDPRNSDVIYVAAVGPLWSSGGDRGVYKSTDGGNSWTLIIPGNFSDAVFDAQDPGIVYAARWAVGIFNRTLKRLASFRR